MRLWHYKLIPVLPNKMLIAQWRECIAIMRQWKKGILKHKLVSYIMDYGKQYFMKYITMIKNEMNNRGINYNSNLYEETYDFCKGISKGFYFYPEHNDRYLNQCYCNLQEKYDRGIITDDEWLPIENLMNKFIEYKLAEENDD